jgi:predicted ATPase
MLIEHSERHALPVWQAWGRCWKGALLLKRGELVTGLPLLQAALEELLNTGFVLRYAGFLGVFAQSLGRAGHVAQGLTTIGDAIARTVDDQGYWCMPELLRVKGELLLLEDARNAEADAEDHFQQALTQAREQGTLGWELRVAMSLARLWHRQARSEEALALLAPVYGRLTEGFTTTDLITARALLDDF